MISANYDHQSPAMVADNDEDYYNEEIVIKQKGLMNNETALYVRFSDKAIGFDRCEMDSLKTLFS